MQARLSKEKRALALALVVEGNTINGICRVLGVGKPALLRFLKECGEACEEWHDRHFRGISVADVEIDEQWAYVGKHKERMTAEEKMENPEKGDCWLWAAIDPASKAVLSWRTGKRTNRVADRLMGDLAKRVEGRVQITTDLLAAYKFAVRGAFGDRADHAAVEKKFGGDQVGHEQQKLAVNRLVGVSKSAESGAPDLESATTSHIERFFLTTRQGNKRKARKTLAYSKLWENHALISSIHLFVYNMVRKHESIKEAPAVKLGVIAKRWSLEDVVEMTERHLESKTEAAFEAAFEAKFNVTPTARRTYKPQTPKTPWYHDAESGGPNPPADQRKPGIAYEGDSESL